MTNPKIQLRHDTKTNWETINPVLLEGEVGVETDTNRFKIGNGASTYTELPYQGTETDLQNYVTKSELAESLDTKRDDFTTNAPLEIKDFGSKTILNYSQLLLKGGYYFSQPVGLGFDEQNRFRFTKRVTEMSSSNMDGLSYIDMMFTPGQVILTILGSGNSLSGYGMTYLLGHKDAEGNFTIKYAMFSDDTVYKIVSIDFTTEYPIATYERLSVTQFTGGTFPPFTTGGVYYRGLIQLKADGNLIFQALGQDQRKNSDKRYHRCNIDPSEINCLRVCSANYFDNDGNIFGGGRNRAWWGVYNTTTDKDISELSNDSDYIDTGYNWESATTLPSDNKLILNIGDGLSVADNKLTVAPVIATTDTIGNVKPDGTTIAVSSDGTISSNAYNKSEIDNLLSNKQDVLTPRDGIQIVGPPSIPNNWYSASATATTPVAVTTTGGLPIKGVDRYGWFGYFPIYGNNLVNKSFTVDFDFLVGDSFKQGFTLPMKICLRNSNECAVTIIFEGDKALRVRLEGAAPGASSVSTIINSNSNKSVPVATTDTINFRMSYEKNTRKTTIVLTNKTTDTALYTYAGVAPFDVTGNYAVIRPVSEQDFYINASAINYASINSTIYTDKFKVYTTSDIDRQYISTKVDNQTIQINSQGQLACNLDEIGADLTTKANTDLSNITEAGLQVIRDNAGSSGTTSVTGFTYIPTTPSSDVSLGYTKITFGDATNSIGITKNNMLYPYGIRFTRDPIIENGMMVDPGVNDGIITTGTLKYFIASVIRYISPNYGSQTEIASGYTCTDNGYIRVNAGVYQVPESTPYNVLVNGAEVISIYDIGTNANVVVHRVDNYIPVCKDDVITFNTHNLIEANAKGKIYFLPYRT